MMENSVKTRNRKNVSMAGNIDEQMQKSDFSGSEETKTTQNSAAEASDNIPSNQFPRVPHQPQHLKPKSRFTFFSFWCHVPLLTFWVHPANSCLCLIFPPLSKHIYPSFLLIVLWVFKPSVPHCLLVVPFHRFLNTKLYQPGLRLQSWSF